MATYRKYNWPELIEAFEQSDLTQTAFSQQQNINPKYFNRKLNKHRRATAQLQGFSRVTIAPSQGHATGHDPVIIEHGRCRIHCPVSMSSSAITELVRALA